MVKIKFTITQEVDGGETEKGEFDKIGWNKDKYF
jgi:hypothetical protein